jgi:hypothetical protein
MRRRKRTAHTGLLALIVLLAFVVRVPWLDAQSLWRDEVDALCYAFRFPLALDEALAPDAVRLADAPIACPEDPISAQGPDRPGLSLRLTEALRQMIRQNGPLYFFLLRGWIALTGHSETALRYFSAWFGVLGAALTYAVGHRLLGRVAGTFAALLAAVSPYLTWYSQEVKMYTLVPALVLVALYALRRAMDGDGVRWWIALSVAATLLLYTHVWGALLIPVLVVFFFVWRPRSRTHWLGGLISLALLTLPYAPLAAWQLRSAFVPRETGFPAYTLGQMALTLLVGWGTGLFGWSWPWGGFICGGVALLGLVSILPLRRGGKGWRTAVGMMSWIALPLLGIWFVSQWQPLFTDRYLIWAAPAFYLLMGAGLACLWRRVGWLALPTLLVVLLVFGGNLWHQTTVPLKSDFRSAATFVERRYDSGDLLIFQIPHGRYTFDYYFGPADYAWAEGLYTNHRFDDGSFRLTPDQAAAELAAMTDGYDRVWLIASEVDMWDQRQLVQGWLDAHGTRLTEGHFARVEVFLTASPSSH